MRKIIALCLFSICVLGKSQSVLWRISGNGLKKPSYLFGTIHLPNTSVYNLSDSLLPAINKSDALALELDFSEMNNPMKMMPYMVLKGDKTLKDFFTEEEYQKLKTGFEERTGMNIALFQKFKPFVLLTMIAQSYFQDGDSAPMALDQFLNYYAITKEIEVYGIETIDEQLAVLDKMPNRILIQAVEDTDSLDAVSDKLIQAYQDGDVELVAKMLEEDDMSGNWMDELLTDRNKVMFDRTEKKLKEGKSMVIAVGCGHLAGETGLIAQYKAKGYQVYPIIASKSQVKESVWSEVGAVAK